MKKEKTSKEKTSIETLVDQTRQKISKTKQSSPNAQEYSAIWLSYTSTLQWVMYGLRLKALGNDIRCKVPRHAQQPLRELLDHAHRLVEGSLFAPKENQNKCNKGLTIACLIQAITTAAFNIKYSESKEDKRNMEEPNTHSFHNETSDNFKYYILNNEGELVEKSIFDRRDGKPERSTTRKLWDEYIKFYSPAYTSALEEMKRFDEKRYQDFLQDHVKTLQKSTHSLSRAHCSLVKHALYLLDQLDVTKFPGAGAFRSCDKEESIACDAPFLHAYLKGITLSSCLADLHSNHQAIAEYVKTPPTYHIYKGGKWHEKSILDRRTTGTGPSTTEILWNTLVAERVRDSVNNFSDKDPNNDIRTALAFVNLDVRFKKALFEIQPPIGKRYNEELSQILQKTNQETLDAFVNYTKALIELYRSIQQDPDSKQATLDEKVSEFRRKVEKEKAEEEAKDEKPIENPKKLINAILKYAKEIPSPTRKLFNTVTADDQNHPYSDVSLFNGTTREDIELKELKELNLKKTEHEQKRVFN